jgi:hypothetical protein
MDIEIFGLDPTWNSQISQSGRPDTQIWEWHVTLLPKKVRFLMWDPPLPTASAGDGRIEPEGRHADVADRPDNFCRHARGPPSSPSHAQDHLAHAYDL